MVARILNGILPTSTLLEFIPLFRQAGEPYLIEYEVDLRDISSYQDSNLADEFINFGIHSKTGKRVPRIYAQGTLYDKIIANHHLKLFPIEIL